MNVKEINKTTKQFTPQLVPEIMEYIDFLINKYCNYLKKKNPFKFNWQGGLSQISKENTSVELQQKAMDKALHLIPSAGGNFSRLCSYEIVWQFDDRVNFCDAGCPRSLCILLI